MIVNKTKDPNVKFGHYEKATKTISHLIWHLLSKRQIKWEIVSKFVAFLENLKFTYIVDGASEYMQLFVPHSAFVFGTGFCVWHPAANFAWNKQKNGFKFVLLKLWAVLKRCQAVVSYSLCINVSSVVEF